MFFFNMFDHLKAENFTGVYLLRCTRDIGLKYQKISKPISPASSNFRRFSEKQNSMKTNVIVVMLGEISLTA